MDSDAPPFSLAKGDTVRTKSSRKHLSLVGTMNYLVTLFALFCNADSIRCADPNVHQVIHQQ